WRGQRQEAPGYRPARVPPPRGRLPGPLSSGGRDDPGVACPQPARSLPLKDQQVPIWETTPETPGLRSVRPLVSPWFPPLVSPEYRLRVGDYRVRFHLEGETIQVLRVRNRREAYR